MIALYKFFISLLLIVVYVKNIDKKWKMENGKRKIKPANF